MISVATATDTDPHAYAGPPKAARIVLPLCNSESFPALRIYTRPKLPSLVAADIGLAGNVFYVRTTKCTMLCGAATMDLANLMHNANVDDDDLHISSFTYHPENESATLVITAYAGRAHILLHANYLPAAMHSSEAMAVECRAR